MRVGILDAIGRRRAPGRAGSPLRDKMVFSFGARRSGTWWLQRIISAHPAVAPVPSESFFFSRAIAPLFDCFQDIDREAPSTGRIYAERELLLDATRDFCDRIFAQFGDRHTQRIAERTPWHVEHLDLMNALYPDAYYIHIVRDGRDSARSLSSMGWFTGSLEDAAAEWRRSVLAARDAGRPARFLEVRYEELMADPATVIPRLYDFLDLRAGDNVRRAALAEARVERNTDARTSVGTEKWRTLMSAEEQAVVLRTAGDALVAYGYASAAERAAALSGAAIS
jgi:sulfotransferase family protein